MIFPLITDPFFYAVSIPAVLLLGISKSGFGAGFGSLAVPMMALAVTVPQAAAILMPVLLVMDLLGMAAFRNDFDRKLLKFLLPFGLLGIVAGTLLFKVLEPKVVAGIVGGFTLLFLAQRLMFPPRPDSAPPPRWAGALLTVTSGFTSFIAHAGGPPFAVYMLAQKLDKTSLVATSVLFFLVTNYTKLVPYALLGQLNHANLAASLLFAPLAPLGIWLGVWLHRRIPEGAFYRVAYGLLFATGAKLVWDALVP